MSETPPPPPPPGGYGAPPPGPGAAGPPPSSGGYSVGDAASYGWAKFQANAGQIVIAGVVVFVGIVVFEIVGIVIRKALVSDPHYVCTNVNGQYPDCHFTGGSGFFVGFFASMLMTFLFFLVYQVVGAGIVRGSLGLTEGKPFVFSDLFKTEGLGPIVVTSLLSSVVIFVGFVLCILPGIVAAFFLQYALYFQIDKGLAPVEALKASATFVREHLGEVILWFLVSYLITIVGAIVCGVGLIVAIPVSLIGTAFTYKRLTGQAVAA